jgi:hypothetical protein
MPIIQSSLNQKWTGCFDLFQQIIYVIKRKVVFFTQTGRQLAPGGPEQFHTVSSSSEHGLSHGTPWLKSEP